MYLWWMSEAHAMFDSLILCPPLDVSENLWRHTRTHVDRPAV